MRVLFRAIHIHAGPRRRGVGRAGQGETERGPDLTLSLSLPTQILDLHLDNDRRS